MTATRFAWYVAIPALGAVGLVAVRANGYDNTRLYGQLGDWITGYAALGAGWLAVALQARVRLISEAGELSRRSAEFIVEGANLAGRMRAGILSVGPHFIDLIGLGQQLLLICAEAEGLYLMRSEERQQVQESFAGISAGRPDDTPDKLNGFLSVFGDAMTKVQKRAG